MNNNRNKKNNFKRFNNSKRHNNQDIVDRSTGCTVCHPYIENDNHMIYTPMIRNY